MAIRAALLLLILVLPASGGEGLPGKGVTPTITFQYTDGTTRTVRLGEALVRRELRHRILSVRVLRGAEVIELLFDTRPPARR